MSDNGATPPEEPKRAIARAQLYIEVKLLDGQQFLFDMSTAEELRDELTLALASVNPPDIAIGKLPEDPQNPEPS